MRNDIHVGLKISSASELFTKSIGVSPDNLPHGSVKSAGEHCVICGYSDFEKGFLISETFSENYGEYPQLLAGDMICPSCYFIIKMNLRRYMGAIFWVSPDDPSDRNAFLISSQSKKPEKREKFDKKTNIRIIYQKDDVLKFILNPPNGMFTICFNKNLTAKNGTHFIPFAKVSLNLNKWSDPCSHYFVSIYDQDVLIDLKFIKNYVEIAKNNSGKLLYFYTLFSHKAFEPFSPLGRRNIIENLDAIKFINYFLRR